MLKCAALAGAYSPGNQTEIDETDGPCCAAQAELTLLTRRLGHDLRAPLRALSTLPQWIREELAEDGAPIPPKAEEYLTMIESRSGRMDSLLVAILEYSKVASADAKISDVDPCSEIDTALREMAPEATCSTDIAPDITGLQIARSDFATVVRHLISNAVRHNTRPDCHIEVRAMHGETFATFEVQDNGPGIDAKQRERIFEPFVTLRPRDEVEGSGLGLATVAKIITCYGGTISVADAPGQGSVFRFRIPKTSASDFPAATDA